MGKRGEAAYCCFHSPLMATYDRSAIQSKGGGDKDAKHKDGNTKDVISSYSRVLVQYGSGITGDCDFKEAFNGCRTDTIGENLDSVR